MVPIYLKVSKTHTMKVLIRLPDQVELVSRSDSSDLSQPTRQMTLYRLHLNPKWYIDPYIRRGPRPPGEEKRTTEHRRDHSNQRYSATSTLDQPRPNLLYCNRSSHIAHIQDNQYTTASTQDVRYYFNRELKYVYIVYLISYSIPDLEGTPV